MSTRKWCLVFFSMVFWVGRAHPQVVLSEIMFDALGSDTYDEFIEIVNLSDTDSVDLTNWQISDGEGFDTIVEYQGGLILKPGQFAVILVPTYFENSETYTTFIPPNSLIVTIDNSTFGSRRLRNTEPETVSILNSAGEVVSEYTYSSDNAEGYSDEKIDLAGANTPDNWANSRKLFGTPGARNSVSPLNNDLAVFSDDLVFSPQKLRAGETVSITATIRNLGKQPATDFKVVFYEDFDGDKLFEAGEELTAPFIFADRLLANDSVFFSVEYSDLASGKHLIGVEIDFAIDGDSTNNRAQKELLVGYKEKAVVVNEIMYSPIPDQKEWVEIINLSSHEIELNQWSISDSDTNSKGFITGRVRLQPNGFYVLAEDSVFLNLFNPPPNSFTILSKWPTLNNNFDSVVLYDFAGNIIDRVNYSEDWGGEYGRSLEKINPGLASNDSSNWSASVTFAGGTPGEKNSIFTEVLPPAASLTIEPNPFSPDEDGKEDFTVISYQLPVATAIVNVKIYDLRGRLVRFLANNRPSGSENLIIWDGKDDNDQKARMGIYIVFLQALNARAGVLKTEKATVVLAGRL